VYRAVEKVPDLPALERRIQELWDRIGAFRQLRERNAQGEPWSFLDGPITANNPMGVHHAWGRSYKDMFQRYHAMHGRRLRYQNGFDCQGLWVEVEVEKELGFSTKRDIVEYGLDRFVRRCKERVLTYAARQTQQSVRLGQWMDWDDPDTLLALRDALANGQESVTVTMASGRTATGSPEQLIGELGAPQNGGSYFTFSTENNYTIWSFLAKCHKEGFLYRGTDVMPWCTRCGTGLSQMEVAEGRKIVKHTSVFVRFPLRGRERESLLVWTTTPWTLTSNVAAAVNPELTYLRVALTDKNTGTREVLYLAKSCFENDRVFELSTSEQQESHKLPSVRKLLERVGTVEILGELAGSELVGLSYDGPFDGLPAQAEASVAHRVLPWKEVTASDGTGIVHIAPGCGAEDAALGREHGLPVVAPLDEAGLYLQGFGSWTGQHVGGVSEPIVADLRARGILVAKEAYPHVYPHCWRCGTELVFRLVDEWFIRMDWRDRIQKVVPQIRWIPADGEARELDWLAHMGDWMISKKRFWGLALPIWFCEHCHWFHVVGSEAELKERAVSGWETFEGHPPHRPWVDAVKIACGECGKPVSRIEDVGNPWLDAGIVPYSTLRFNTDPAYWEEWFPADFVVESFPGQFRNWFYALLAMSAMMSGRPPFKQLLGHALVRDARGQEMHKSRGNSIPFDVAAEAFGAELMRFLYASQNPVQNLNFPDLPKAGEAREGGKGKQQTVDAELRSRLLTWWNCYSFFVTYAAADGWVPPAQPMPASQRSQLDRWLLSRLHRLIGATHKAFEGCTLYRAIHDLERFLEDLSNWWLRRSRRRFWGSEGTADKQAAFETLYDTLETLCRLLAHVLPFLTEDMWQNLAVAVRPGAPTSVHLAPYPQVDASLLDEALEARIDTVLKVKELALGLRNQAKARARQPLGKLWVKAGSQAERQALSEASLVSELLDEVNVKELLLVEDESALVKTELKPNFAKLKERYKDRIQAVAAAVPSARALPSGRYAVTVGTETLELVPEEVLLQRSAAPGVLVAASGPTVVLLDTQLTPALEREGLARDFNRAAQDLRKDSGLAVTDRIRVAYHASDAVEQALREHDDWLRGELLAVEIVRATASLGQEPAKVGGEPVEIRVERV
jgi:isoleucyl-tRNA synthetase